MFFSEPLPFCNISVASIVIDAIAAFGKDAARAFFAPLAALGLPLLLPALDALAFAITACHFVIGDYFVGSGAYLPSCITKHTLQTRKKQKEIKKNFFVKGCRKRGYVLRIDLRT